MVDKSKALDIDGSMASHEWSTEEFSHVLPTFTEMVGYIWVILRISTSYMYILLKIKGMFANIAKYLHYDYKS